MHFLKIVTTKKKGKYIIQQVTWSLRYHKVLLQKPFERKKIHEVCFINNIFNIQNCAWLHDTFALTSICFRKRTADIRKETSFFKICFLMELTQSFGAGKKLVMLSSIVWKCTKIHYLHLNIWRPSTWFLWPFFKSVQCANIRKYRDIHS